MRRIHCAHPWNWPHQHPGPPSRDDCHACSMLSRVRQCLQPKQCCALWKSTWQGPVWTGSISWAKFFNRQHITVLNNTHYFFPRTARQHCMVIHMLANCNAQHKLQLQTPCMHMQALWSPQVLEPKMKKFAIDPTLEQNQHNVPLRSLVKCRLCSKAGVDCNMKNFPLTASCGSILNYVMMNWNNASSLIYIYIYI